MDPTINSPAPASTPLSTKQRVKLANRLYREYDARCFWHSPPDLIITENLIPVVVKGLRKHGGRRGFLLSAQIKCASAPMQGEGEELPECR